MKALVINEFGDPKVFRQQTLPYPRTLASNQVLIKIAASSVNPVDIKIRSGAASVIAPEFPAILHGDVAGTIVQIGTEVTKFQMGDQVYGCAGGVKGMAGALAEYMVADADLLAIKPHSLSMTEAAALPLVGITAYEALFQRTKILPGQKVLIHGGTGGVGHIAIQLAKAQGATVFTTVSSPEKSLIAKKIGADVMIDYRTTTVENYVNAYTKGQGFNLVFDTVGGANLDRSFEAAALNGMVVSISTHSEHNLSLLHNKGLTLHVVFMLIPLLHNINRANHGAILQELARLVDEGKVCPLIDSQFSFVEVAQAHQRAESGLAIGKVILTQDL
jgi:NADPH2:quinone reductase